MRPDASVGRGLLHLGGALALAFGPLPRAGPGLPGFLRAGRGRATLDARRSAPGRRLLRSVRLPTSGGAEQLQVGGSAAQGQGMHRGAAWSTARRERAPADGVYRL